VRRASFETRKDDSQATSEEHVPRLVLELDGADESERRGRTTCGPGVPIDEDDASAREI